MMNRWQTSNIHSFAPKMEAVEDFIKPKDHFMKKTVWDEECRSWYKNNSASAKASALWPGSTLHYMEAMGEVMYDHWDIKYNGNQFAWLGNRYSQTALDPTADWSYYICNEDYSPYLSTGKQREITTKRGSQAGSKEVPGWAPKLYFCKHGVLCNSNTAVLRIKFLYLEGLGRLSKRLGIAD